MYSVDYPFESHAEASQWFDHANQVRRIARRSGARTHAVSSSQVTLVSRDAGETEMTGEAHMANTGLAESSVWSGKIYSNGWRERRGAAFSSRLTDKSTGERLGEIGRASVKDVASARP